ncbi:MAG TPA: metallophosphoesterase [Verrucomicrobiae bacterium]|nr:metallophosphoesterase [Verrucomicrobiae bacterium]
MLQLRSISEEPILRIPYRFPRTGGGVEVADFPVYAATAEGLPEGLGGLLLASDLQGMELRKGEGGARLLGHAVAEEVAFWLEGSDGPPPMDIGVVLAGDLHVDADLAKRGGKGDVRDVWHAFGRCFRWVCGVAGNHDRFGTDQELRDFAAEEGIHYLDADMRRVDGLLMAGVGGVIGNPRKLFRRDEATYVGLVRRMLANGPSLLVLHESPEMAELGHRGSRVIRECLDRSPPTLVACGHCHWKHPGLGNLRNGAQVINTDARAVLALWSKL